MSGNKPASALSLNFVLLRLNRLRGRLCLKLSVVLNQYRIFLFDEVTQLYFLCSTGDNVAKVLSRFCRVRICARKNVLTRRK